MPTFHANEIRVFNRAGAPIGVLTNWSVEQPRSFRLNEIEDFAFSMPRQLDDGNVVLTADVVNNLLFEDNLVYLANHLYGMRGWAGVIKDVDYGDDKVVVSCVGGLSLVRALDAALVEQDDGDVWTIASRLVSAAQAKQAAHGDLQVGFVHDETAGKFRRNYGHFSYEGDVFAGLQQLGTERICEFFAHGRVRTNGHLAIDIRWGGRYVIDKTDIVIKDGDGGALMPGNHVTFTSTDLVNRVRLRGAPTQLAEFMHYENTRSLVHDITPECEIVLDDETDSRHRRREQLGLTVGFGYSRETQQALAEQIELKFLGYFKAYVYAYHARLGKPYLEGYDWSGPDGNNDKRLTAHFFRNYSRLGYIGKRTVIVGSADDDDVTNIDARIDDWQYISTTTPVANCVGVAVKWDEPDSRWLADAATGSIYELDADTTLTLWQGVVGSGETLKSVATDPTQATLMWVLVANGTTATIKTYNASDKNLVSTFSFTLSGANDIAVDSIEGILWIVATSSVNVQARDLSSGTLISARTFDSGLSAPVGLSMSGGLAYVIDATGHVRFLYAEDGNLAGTKATAVAANGLFLDAQEGRLWIIRSNGSIEQFRAHIAVSTINPPGSVDGAPGFEAISAGQFVHIVMNSDTAATPHTRKTLLSVYSKGRYITSTVPGNLGQPDVLQRTWITDDQHVTYVKRTAVHWASPEQIIQGEESRVDDWNPKQDGYGYYGAAVYKTRRGAAIRYTRGWFFRDWDIPDSAFQPDPPEFTSGLAYLQGYLAKQNKRRPTQVLRVVNIGGLWKKIVLGGKYTVRVTRQGPPGGFPDAIFRVLSYTPDERQGIMELIGEWL